MTGTMVVCGYGPGISSAVARKFGAEGFSVALVARNEVRLQQAAKALSEAGVNAKGFPCDLGDPDAVRRTIGEIRGALGPIAVIHWNAYAGVAGDLTTCDIDDLRKVFDVGVCGLVAAVQASLSDMKAAENAALLVTGGGFASYDDQVDDMIVQYNAMGIALSKAAQHKLVGVLHKKLAGDGIYVGEVVVLGTVKGTAFDSGQASIDPADVAAKFWEIYRARSVPSVNCG